MKTKYLLLIVVFSAAGLAALMLVRATAPNLAFEVSSDQLVSKQSDDSSEGSYVEFEDSVVAQRSFRFAAVGDFRNGNEAKAVFKAISENQTDFTLALGDLGYTGNGNEVVWCTLVKGILGNDYPFELVAGNHDDRSSGDGDILEYRKCLPDRIGNITGDYAIEYFFDYKDIARIIMISPDIDNYGGDYGKGGTNYNWVKQSVMEAKNAGIEWVFLGMHKNCITPGVKTCDIGPDILNLAIETGVDVILQGHEHGYFRSSQWALSADCPVLEVNKYNEACVGATGDDFVKDAGSVLVISGAGGISLRDADFGDEEVDYFEAINAKNIGKTHGFALFEITNNKLTNRFVGVNGDFADAFTITKP